MDNNENLTNRLTNSCINQIKKGEINMKRILVLITLPILMLIMVTPVLAQTPYTTDLIADGRDTALDVGTLIVDTNSDNLTVTFQIDEASVDWRLEETHLFVGDEVPAKSAPGKFPYKQEGLGSATSDIYEIDLAAADQNDDGVVYIAAHAALIRQAGVDPVTGDPIFEDETAWAQGEEPIGKGKNWATYFVVQLP
jgi:hypothetical protein